jgi:hypothetical protein
MFADNIGHLGKGGRDGWGRAFCKGLEYAIIGDYDWVVHIEGDSLCREPLRPAVEKFAAEGIRVIAPPLRPKWVETGLMMFSVGWLTGHEFIQRYNWDQRVASPHPEEVIYELIGGDWYLLPWPMLRDDASKLTPENVGNYLWISHTSMDNLRRFAELGRQPTRLHFGCGSNRLPGWTNFDAEVDISKPLPFFDASGSHLLRACAGMCRCAPRWTFSPNASACSSPAAACALPCRQSSRSSSMPTTSTSVSSANGRVSI